MKNNNNNNNLPSLPLGWRVENVLPSELHSIFIGIMLSDGGLYKSSPTSNVRFEISFGEKYKELALYIGEKFKEYRSNPVKALQIKGLQKVYTNYRLKTRTLPIFYSYHDMFYKWNIETNKYIKIIPENIIDLMDPIVLAYLIQGDGNLR